MASLSIIMPVLNEAGNLIQVLGPLQALRRQDCELIVVDGGSTDNTVAIATPLTDQVLTAERGRASQMNAGARASQGAILWFLHGDTLPPEDAAQAIRTALEKPARHWGRFDVRLSGSCRSLRLVESLMNWRSRLSGIATGDQGIFVRRSTFFAAGGYPAIALMEDIALSRILKRFSRPACLSQRLLTSSRRWEQDGVWRTILLMGYLRLRYFLGADPSRLARIYYPR